MFGSSCSYLHFTKVEENDIDIIKKDLNNVIALLHQKDKEIEALAGKVAQLESKFEVFSCDNCDQFKNTSPVFSKHKETIHEAVNIQFSLPSSLPIPTSLPPAPPGMYQMWPALQGERGEVSGDVSTSS